MHLTFRTFELGSCGDANALLVEQIKKWESANNCQSGGEKCLYAVIGMCFVLLLLLLLY